MAANKTYSLKAEFTATNKASRTFKDIEASLSKLKALADSVDTNIKISVNTKNIEETSAALEHMERKAKDATQDRSGKISMKGIAATQKDMDKLIKKADTIDSLTPEFTADANVEKASKKVDLLVRKLNSLISKAYDARLGANDREARLVTEGTIQYLESVYEGVYTAKLDLDKKKFDKKAAETEAEKAKLSKDAEVKLKTKNMEKTLAGFKDIEKQIKKVNMSRTRIVSDSDIPKRQRELSAYETHLKNMSRQVWKSVITLEDKEAVAKANALAEYLDRSIEKVRETKVLLDDRQAKLEAEKLKAELGTIDPVKQVKLDLKDYENMKRKLASVKTDIAGLTNRPHIIDLNGDGSQAIRETDRTITQINARLKTVQELQIKAEGKGFTELAAEAAALEVELDKLNHQRVVLRADLKGAKEATAGLLGVKIIAEKVEGTYKVRIDYSNVDLAKVAITGLASTFSKAAQNTLEFVTSGRAVGLIVTQMNNVIQAGVVALIALAAAAAGPVVASLTIAAGAVLALVAAFGLIAAAAAPIAIAWGKQKKQATELKTAQSDLASSTKEVETAQKAVGDANQAVNDAIIQREDSVKSAIKAHEDALKQVEQAQRGVDDARAAATDAQKQEAQAVQDLNAALATEKYRINDLKFEIQGLALDSKELALDIKDAEAELAKAAPGEERQRAEINLQRLLLRRKELTQQQEEAQLSLNDAQKNGTDELQSAEEARQQAAKASADAMQGIKDAVDNLASAQQDAADSEKAITKARIDGNRQVADAQERATEAQKQLTDALKKQSSAQKLVNTLTKQNKNYINDAINRIKAFGKAFQKAFEPATKRLTKFGIKAINVAENDLPALADASVDVIDAMDKMSTQSGKEFKQFGVIKSMKQLLKSIAPISATISHGLVAMIGGFLNVLAVGLPQIRGFAKWIEQIGVNFEKWTASDKGRKQISKFFESAAPVAKVLWKHIKSIAGSLLSWSIKHPKELATWIDRIAKFSEDAVKFVAKWVGRIIVFSEAHPNIAKAVFALLLLNALSGGGVIKLAAALVRIAFISGKAKLGITTLESAFNRLGFYGAKAFSKLAKWFRGSWLDKAISYIAKKIGGMKITKWVVTALNKVKGSVFGEIAGRIGSGIASKLLGAAAKVFSGPVGWAWLILDTLTGGALTKGLLQFFKDFTKGWRKGWKDNEGVLKNIFTAFLSGIWSSLRWKDILKGFWKGFDKAGKEGGKPSFKKMAHQVAQGILEGLKNVPLVGPLIKWVDKYLAKPIKNTFDKLFGINSPSKWASKRGHWIAMGIRNGLNSVKFGPWVDKMAKTFGKVKNKAGEIFGRMRKDVSTKFDDMKKAISGKTNDAKDASNKNTSIMQKTGVSNANKQKSMTVGHFGSMNKDVSKHTNTMKDSSNRHTGNMKDTGISNANKQKSDTTKHINEMESSVSKNTNAMKDASNRHMHTMKDEGVKTARNFRDDGSAAMGNAAEGMANPIHDAVQKILDYMVGDLPKGMQAVVKALGLSLKITLESVPVVGPLLKVAESFFAKGGEHEVYNMRGRFMQFNQDKKQPPVGGVTNNGPVRVYGEVPGTKEVYITNNSKYRPQNENYLKTAADMLGYDAVPKNKQTGKDWQLAKKARRNGRKGPMGESPNNQMVEAATGMTVQYFAEGGFSEQRLHDLVTWAHKYDGSPYVWGGSSPGATDCSGWAGLLDQFALGNPSPNGRIGATSTMPWSGWISGPGQISHGWINGGPGGGHTAATIVGNGWSINSETGGGAGGTMTGGSAWGATNSYFNQIHHLGSGTPLSALGSGGGSSGPDVSALIDKYIPDVPTLDKFLNDGITKDIIHDSGSKVRKAVVDKIMKLAPSGSSFGGGNSPKGLTIGKVVEQTWPENERREAAAIIYRESGGNASAINDWDSNAAAGTPSVGLMQIIEPTAKSVDPSATTAKLKDPLYNSHIGSLVQNAQGWGPWTTSAGWESFTGHENTPITGYRHGGLAFKPHFGVFGDRGTSGEAVIPLDDTKAVRAISRAVSNSETSNTSTVTVTQRGSGDNSVTISEDMKDVKEIMKQVHDKLDHIGLNERAMERLIEMSIKTALATIMSKAGSDTIDKTIGDKLDFAMGLKG